MVFILYYQVLGSKQDRKIKKVHSLFLNASQYSREDTMIAVCDRAWRVAHLYPSGLLSHAHCI